MSSDSSRKLETPEQTYSRMALEAECRRMGKAIATCMPEGVGFCFLMFDVDGGGGTTYLSNIKRSEVVARMAELLAKLKQSD